MLFSILIFGVEGVWDQLPQEQQEREMQQHRDLQAELSKAQTLGPVVQLMSPSSAVTVRQRGNQQLVLDGPFAETKEQFLGFYVVECASLEEAIAVAQKLPTAIASYEVRPIQWAGGTMTTHSDG